MPSGALCQGCKSLSQMGPGSSASLEGTALWLLQTEHPVLLWMPLLTSPALLARDLRGQPAGCRGESASLHLWVTGGRC